MRSVKLIFIAVEIACIIGVITLAFTEVTEDFKVFKAVYISLFCLLSVVMQKEQQMIDWNEED